MKVMTCIYIHTACLTDFNECVCVGQEHLELSQSDFINESPSAGKQLLCSFMNLQYVNPSFT